MNDELILAVDGGGSKTDVAILRTNGELVAFRRGPQSSPHYVGLEGALDVIEQIVGDCTEPFAAAAVMLAGADRPDEEYELQKAVERRGIARTVVTGNDTFAVLRAGTDRGWGVAVVCGSGINCVGVGPDGRHARFQALGTITGDWGGGYDVGLAALGEAVRALDGRGPETTLAPAIAAHFGEPDAAAVADAVHGGRIARARLGELAPLVFDACERDEVARGLVVRLEAEVAAFVRAAIDRLDLRAAPVHVVLGGSVLRNAPPAFLSVFEAELAEIAPDAAFTVVDALPVAGAALAALDRLDAAPEAKERARRSLVREPELVRPADG